ncbi:Toll-like receptor 4 [Mytilus edulis]|uniref:Toll-like receptor 4 n=1 Tax=Mytilus edulis TaxID=6550 RepID=A0A8S3PY68_MYTED|nr:Toll-like receptor 4 [Mytilus edulis]
MTKTRVIFLHQRQYRCVLDDGSEVTLDTLKEIIHQQQKDCVSYSDILIGSTISVFTVIVLLLSALVYKYRWKFRTWFYLAKSKHYSYKASNEDDIDYSYHSFISYSDNDRSFVIKIAFQTWKKDEEFKLCVHQRDFLPGQDITVNITNAIHESRKTICIISKAFFESYYCMFEFNMASMESIYSRDGKNIIFLIFLEQIQTKDIPLVMLELVQKQSYIEYPNDEQGNIVFWEEIQEALRC